MITTREFGKNNKGEKVTLYTIENGNAKVCLSDFGANVVSFYVKDKNGKLTDIVLGYDSAEGYDNDRGTYFGAFVGRFANRIENGRFTIDGKEYEVSINFNDKHILHGGFDGFSFQMHKALAEGNSVTFSRVSPDGEEGFPGNLDYSVKYTLNGTSLEIEYFAESDKDTVCGFTNHSYFNLNGATTGTTVLNHYLELDADGYGEVDDMALANGHIHPVEGTVYDFRKPTLLSERLGCGHKALEITGDGIDNNFLLWATSRELSFAGSLYCPQNGIKLDCYTDLPGVQIYTGTFIDTVGKEGTKYGKFSSICLETQGFPNSTTYRYLPSAILRKGEKYYTKTVYTASVK